MIQFSKQSCQIFPFAPFLEQPKLIEGDIVDDIATQVQMEAEAAADGLSNTFDAISGNRKWQNGVVPYVYGSVGKFTSLRLRLRGNGHVSHVKLIGKLFSLKLNNNVWIENKFS